MRAEQRKSPEILRTRIDAGTRDFGNDGCEHRTQDGMLAGRRGATNLSPTRSHSRPSNRSA
jgi:hypothetical protein